MRVKLTITDMLLGPLQVFHGVEKGGNIVHILKTTGHNGFLVVDEPPHSDMPVLYGLDPLCRPFGSTKQERISSCLFIHKL